ncbi:peptide-methionine (S)-S-oxide reductase MsrA [Tepidimonas charontis]|uniref:Peptide methionine sulfoxide reductase MsrA n=1 Tax=Tepidimonas charontis TaxID=2267262 RepID=A0A554XFN1_9BURK|nr:peptide-methionine (S)-S-oxide reductase MsrA [Tepidimonas charontis]TSE34624.1 Peptide methionine sulfoxide reductase MsrA [Tepidimonas charontis]
MTVREWALGGGCFWCTEAVFDRVRGVLDVESGYCNGWAERPSYEEVCSGMTGCVEVVRLRYDPAVIDERTLLTIFFAIHDPTTPNRQGADVGTQYRSGIYWTEPLQAQAARALMAELQTAGVFAAPIVTEVEPLRHYWPAEDYHQDFFARHPHHGYCVAVVNPKVAKLRQRFASWLKPGADAA